MAYLIFVPWVFVAVESVTGHDGARVAEVALLALAGSSLVPVCYGRKISPGSDLTALLATCLLIGALVVALHAPDVDWAFRELALFVGMYALALVIGELDGAWFERLAWAAVMAVVLYNALLLFVALASLSTGLWPDPANLAPGYNNYRLFNHVQTVAVSLLAGIAIAAPSRLLRNLAHLGIATGLTLLLHAGARASLLALACGSLFALILTGRPGLRLARHLAGTVLAGLLVYGAVFIVLPWACGAGVPVAKALRLDSVATDGSRLSLWRSAWHAIREAPVWGIGPMQFAAGSHANPVGAHPHNFLLQIAAEWGVPMAALVTAAITVGLMQLVQYPVNKFNYSGRDTEPACRRPGL